MKVDKFPFIYMAQWLGSRALDLDRLSPNPGSAAC